MALYDILSGWPLCCYVFFWGCAGSRGVGVELRFSRRVLWLACAWASAGWWGRAI